MRSQKNRQSAVDTTVIFVTKFFVMTEAVTFFRALADETRWRIVRLVMEQALCVCELADILGMPQSSVSSHVQVIRRAGLLESETCGKWTYFRIGRGQLAPLRAVAKHFPDGNVHTKDAAKAAARLARRETSCCPGPVKLGQRRKAPSPMPS
jgi:ArsR family transcriptional regulator